MSGSASAFSGRTLRVVSSTRVPGRYFEKIDLGIWTREQDLSLQRHLSRKTRAMWISDEYPFEDLPKLEPALVYRRFVPSGWEPAAFCEQYLGVDPATLAPIPPRAGYDVLPWAGDPGPADPATVELRRKLLNQVRDMAAGEDDPWFQVETAYSFLTTRGIVQVEGGFEDQVWFLSTGPDGDGPARLNRSIRDRLQQHGGAIVAQTGPHEAYHIGHVNSGISFVEVLHLLADDQECIDRFVDFTHWQKDPPDASRTSAPG